MKKENHSEQAHTEEKKDSHFATKWMNDMADIFNETYRKQMDISFERMNMMAKTNINFLSGLLNAVSPARANHYSKNGKVSNYWETDFTHERHNHKEHAHSHEKAHTNHKSKA